VTRNVPGTLPPVRPLVARWRPARSERRPFWRKGCWTVTKRAIPRRVPQATETASALGPDKDRLTLWREPQRGRRRKTINCRTVDALFAEGVRGLVDQRSHHDAARCFGGNGGHDG